MSSPGSIKTRMVKIILIGDGTVGKTSLRREFTGNRFEENYSMTMGAEFSVHRKGDFMLQLYDLAGQDNFREVRKSYYRGSQGAILVFDIGKPRTFRSLDAWMQELLSYVDLEIPIVVVGNKLDLRDRVETSISTETALQWIRDHQRAYNAPIRYMETSVTEHYHVFDVFQQLSNYLQGVENTIFDRELVTAEELGKTTSRLVRVEEEEVEVPEEIKQRQYAPRPEIERERRSFLDYDS
ncbi:MAG: Rab family GTPase [Candidatus Kariarchaeaceae archaeon]|jgi:small GTP-binding protein